MRLSKLLPARADQRTGSDSEASVLAGWHSTGSLGSVPGVSRTHDSGMLCNCTRLMESVVWSGNATRPAFGAPDVHPITPRAGNGPAETSFLPPFRVVPWQRIRTSSRKTFRFGIARTLALRSRPNGEGPLRNLSKIIFQAFLQISSLASLRTFRPSRRDPGRFIDHLKSTPSRSPGQRFSEKIFSESSSCSRHATSHRTQLRQELFGVCQLRRRRRFFPGAVEVLISSGG